MLENDQHKSDNKHQETPSETIKAITVQKPKMNSRLIHWEIWQNLKKRNLQNLMIHPQSKSLKRGAQIRGLKKY